MGEIPVKIKGDEKGLVIIIDNNASIDIIEADLIEKINNHQNYFPENSTVRVLYPSISGDNKRRLENLFTVRKLSLVFIDEAPAKVIADRTKDTEFKKMLNKLNLASNPVLAGNTPTNEEEATPAVPYINPLPPAPKKDEMLVINRTVRGGEEIKTDGSVLICGNVHEGAHIVAGGNIDIRGTLKGNVHAGVHGDTSAIIIADQMMPTLIRIANLIARSPEDDQASDKAEKAYIKQGRIVVEPVTR